MLHVANRHRACCLLECACCWLPRSRCLSAPPRAPTIFSASRNFAILSLAVAIISLTTISFVPYAQQIDFYVRLTAAATRCTFTVPGAQVSHPSNPTPQPRSLILTLIPITSDRLFTHPAALLLSGYTSRSPLRWSWLELAGAGCRASRAAKPRVERWRERAAAAIADSPPERRV